MTIKYASRYLKNINCKAGSELKRKKNNRFLIVNIACISKKKSINILFLVNKTSFLLTTETISLQIYRFI